MEVKIRMAEEKDRITLLHSRLSLMTCLNKCRLDSELFRSNLEADYDRFEEAMSGFSPEIILVAEVGRGVVGYCSFDVGSSERVTFLNNLYVNPNFRGLGIGTSLVDEVKKLSEFKGMTSVVLHSSSKEVREGFYQKIGFVPANEYGNHGLECRIQ